MSKVPNAEALTAKGAKGRAIQDIQSLMEAHNLTSTDISSTDKGSVPSAGNAPCN